MKNNHLIFSFPLVLLSLLLIACNEKGKLPTVTTGIYTTYPGSKTVKCEGYVETDGGEVVMDRGICYMAGYSTPTITDNSVNAGSGKGAFSAVLQNIEQGTYSYRAYATNSTGTAYGDVCSFTMSNSSSSGGGGTKYTLSDFVGTYSCHAYNWDAEEYEDWTDVKIYTFDDDEIPSAVAVEGLLLGYGFFTAIGQFDEAKQCVRLFSSWYFTENTFGFTGNDTVFSANFYPVYAAKEATSFHWITSGTGFEGSGEAWLTFDSNGKLNLGSSDTPDSENYYANGMCWQYFASDKPSVVVGRFHVYIEIALTKTSSSAMPPRNIPALIRQNKQYKTLKGDRKSVYPYRTLQSKAEDNLCTYSLK